MRFLMVFFVSTFLTAAAYANLEGIQQNLDSVNYSQKKLVAVVVYDQQDHHAVCAISPQLHPEITPRNLAGVAEKTNDFGLPQCSEETAAYLTENVQTLGITQVAGLPSGWHGACFFGGVAGVLTSMGLTNNDAVPAALGAAGGGMTFGAIGNVADDGHRQARLAVFGGCAAIGALIGYFIK